jgi:hypothetical protein
MSWLYRQSTGEIFARLLAPIGLNDPRQYFPDRPIGKGYAGREAGKNKPSMQNVKGIGPLPRGWYVALQPPADDAVVGKYAIRLSPDRNNEMFGRNSFFMHGDSTEHPGLASHGCIVMPRAVREKFWAEDSDHVIQVIE